MNHDYTIHLVATLQGKRVELPVRVIADTDDGMFVDVADVFSALLFEKMPAFSDEAADNVTELLSAMYGFEQCRFQRAFYANKPGHIVRMDFAKVSGVLVHHMWCIWENTVAPKLHSKESNQISYYSDVVAHVDATYPNEWTWDVETSTGKHRQLPITVFAGGCHLSFLKVHVDVPDAKQVVFRGDTERVNDLIEQAKAKVSFLERRR